MRKMHFIPLVTVLALSLGACTPSSAPPTSGTDDVVTHPLISEVTVAERVTVALMEDFDFERHQAAGIAGNLAQESGQFQTLAEINGSCYGYSQWCGSRKAEFLSFAKRNGGKESFTANYGFLKLEMSRDYPEMIARIRRTPSVASSAEIFMREFLRPHKDHANLPRRIQYGRQYNAGDFSGSACKSARAGGCTAPVVSAIQVDPSTFRIISVGD